jgi:hypothetical protein
MTNKPRILPAAQHHPLPPVTCWPRPSCAAASSTALAPLQNHSSRGSLRFSATAHLHWHHAAPLLLRRKSQLVMTPSHPQPGLYITQFRFVLNPILLVVTLSFFLYTLSRPTQKTQPNHVGHLTRPLLKKKKKKKKTSKRDLSPEIQKNPNPILAKSKFFFKFSES